MKERSFTWPIFRRVWRRAAQFEQMTSNLNINTIAAAKLDQGDAIACAHDRCLECRHARECRDWLEASDGLPLPPDFCPNREFFARCEKREEPEQEELL